MGRVHPAANLHRSPEQEPHWPAQRHGLGKRSSRCFALARAAYVLTKGCSLGENINLERQIRLPSEPAVSDSTPVAKFQGNVWRRLRTYRWPRPSRFQAATLFVSPVYCTSASAFSAESPEI